MKLLVSGLLATTLALGLGVPRTEAQSPHPQCADLAGHAQLSCGNFMDWYSVSGNGFNAGKDNLGWGESRVLRALLQMYKATGKQYFLDEMLSQIDTVWSLRDDIAGTPDWKGRLKAYWSKSQGDDENGVPLGHHGYVVHSGMITYPIVKLVQHIYDTPALNNDPVLKAKADDYLVKVQEVVAAHNYRWKAEDYRDVDIRPDEGFYFWAGNDLAVKESNRGWNVPHNQQLAMGSTLLALYEITQDLDYKDKARRMGRIFWRDLSTSGSNYLWHYWWGSSLVRDDRLEDFGHGMVDLEFMMEAFNSGFNIVNSTTPFPVTSDMNRFAASFRNIYHRSPTRYAEDLDGTTRTPPNKGTVDRAGGYIGLAQWDEGVYDDIYESYVSNSNDLKTPAGSSSYAPLAMQGWANLTYWAVELGKGLPPADGVFTFEGDTQGWTNEACNGYAYSLGSGSAAHSGSGYLTVSEGSGNPSCNPAAVGSLELNWYQDFENLGGGFQVSGWARARSDYSGSSSVTNYCVKLLDTATLTELASECQSFANSMDSGWVSFDHDFTAAVAGVNNVRVVIGIYDSWAADWDQSIFIDDVTVVRN